eukprot:CAMPEP_0198673928 /NCGR_PEP_ID=MMETSP1467-20131203/97654_1 /TAXON_ID=1462469 /ORGANISM="unid. sp., Strain CCMP2135" /LENGTH=752 /DNA_ID=CAMNT_0044410815 /DNA_START=22 /DNA_END=2282 /DNA_ORIENTATION=-
MSFRSATAESKPHSKEDALVGETYSPAPLKLTEEEVAVKALEEETAGSKEESKEDLFDRDAFAPAPSEVSEKQEEEEEEEEKAPTENTDTEGCGSYEEACRRAEAADEWAPILIERLSTEECERAYGGIKGVHLEYEEGGATSAWLIKMASPEHDSGADSVKVKSLDVYCEKNHRSLFRGLKDRQRYALRALAKARRLGDYYEFVGSRATISGRRTLQNVPQNVRAFAASLGLQPLMFSNKHVTADAALTVSFRRPRQPNETETGVQAIMQIVGSRATISGRRTLQNVPQNVRAFAASLGLQPVMFSNKHVTADAALTVSFRPPEEPNETETGFQAIMQTPFLLELDKSHRTVDAGVAHAAQLLRAHPDVGVVGAFLVDEKIGCLEDDFYMDVQAIMQTPFLLELDKSHRTVDAAVAHAAQLLKALPDLCVVGAFLVDEKIGIAERDFYAAYLQFCRVFDEDGEPTENSCLDLAIEFGTSSLPTTEPILERALRLGQFFGVTHFLGQPSAALQVLPIETRLDDQDRAALKRLMARASFADASAPTALRKKLTIKIAPEKLYPASAFRQRSTSLELDLFDVLLQAFEFGTRSLSTTDRILTRALRLGEFFGVTHCLEQPSAALQKLPILARLDDEDREALKRLMAPASIADASSPPSPPAALRKKLTIEISPEKMYPAGAFRSRSTSLELDLFDVLLQARLAGFIGRKRAREDDERTMRNPREPSFREYVANEASNVLEDFSSFLPSFLLPSS